MEKTYDTRIQTKKDKLANWVSNDPVLLDGEIILVEMDDGEIRQKVGNGTSKYSELPFSDETIKSAIPTKTSQLTNDSGFKTTDNNTTYSLSKSGSTIMLTGSDGTATSVVDSDTTYGAAGSSLGLMKSGGDLTIADGVAMVNDDSHNHVISNVDGLQSALDTKVPHTRTVNGKELSKDIELTANDVGADASGSAEAVQDNLDNHTSNTSNPHGVTAAQVGAVPTTRTVNGKALSTDISLNASDVGADESGAANTALTNAKAYTDTALETAKGYTDTEISELINSAPTTLDTLGEIATAMEENADVVAALETAIGTKANASDLSAHTTNTSNPHGVTKAQVGLGNVDNTADANKSVKYATSAGSATNDSEGQNIANTYIKGLSVSGNIITYTKGDGGTGTLTTQDTTYSLSSFGVTATAAELNYVDGVTSNIQTQINALIARIAALEASVGFCATEADM